MCTVPSIIISVLLILTKCLLDEWLKRNNYDCSRKHSYEKESWYIGDNFWVNVVYVTKFIVLFMLSNWKICRGEEGNIIDQTGSILIIHFFEMFGWEKRRKKEENLASICQGGVWGGATRSFCRKVGLLRYIAIQRRPKEKPSLKFEGSLDQLHKIMHISSYVVCPSVTKDYQS